MQSQKGSFVTDKSLVLRDLESAAEEQACAGQQEILERESLLRVETSTHAIVTNIVRYATENDKVAPPKDNEVNHCCSSRTKRQVEDTAGSNSTLPKKLKYFFLKDE
jgi:NAD+-dependent protein deacetylase sirtuin 6